MDFIVDDPRDLTHDLRSTVEHRPQNLGRHNETGRRRVDGDVSSHESDVAKLGEDVSVLLVRERLNGTRVDDPLLALEALGDRILGDDRLSGRRVRRDEDRLLPLDGSDGNLLEGVELEGIDTRWGNRRDVLRYRDVGVGRRDGDAVADLAREIKAK
jgi:hypothetical protein